MTYPSVLMRNLFFCFSLMQITEILTKLKNQLMPQRSKPEHPVCTIFCCGSIHLHFPHFGSILWAGSEKQTWSCQEFTGFQLQNFSLSLRSLTFPYGLKQSQVHAFKETPFCEGCMTRILLLQFFSCEVKRCKNLSVVNASFYWRWKLLVLFQICVKLDN